MINIILIPLQTTRFILREFQPEDAEYLFQMNEDWDCIKYTGDVAFKNLEAAENFIKNYDHYQKYGFGRWTVLDKVSGEFLGWCGLKYDEELHEYDLGFRFLKKHWGKGFATEASVFCLKLGFEKFKIPEIVGRVMPENLVSIKVLEKSGMIYKETRTKNGVEWLILSIKNKR